MKKKTSAIITYDTEEDTYDIELKNPLSVCWQITTKCNLNCKYCLSDSGIDGQEGLKTREAIDVINQLGELGINRLDFTGGEPLLRKDLEKLIQCAKYNHINTIVTTNSILLTQENINALKLADLVQISIDGPREIHNKQRQKEVFDETIENIKKLKEEGCKIRLNSFIYNTNKQYVDYLMNLSKELNVFSHLFIIFTPQDMKIM